MVSIDDDSVRRMAGIVGRWPWPRLAHATLHRLSRSRAREARRLRRSVHRAGCCGASRSVRRSGPAPNRTRRWRMRSAKSGNVILAADAAAEELLDPSKALHVPLDGIPSLNQPFKAGDCVEARPQLIPPIDILARAARAIGHSFGVVDADGPARRMIPFVRVGGARCPVALGCDGARSRRTSTPSAVHGIPRRLTIGVHDDSARRANRARLLRRAHPGVSHADPISWPERHDRRRDDVRGTILLRLVPFGDPAAPGGKAGRRSVHLQGSHRRRRRERIRHVRRVSPRRSALPSPGAEIHANAIDALLRARTLEPVRRCCLAASPRRSPARSPSGLRALSSVRGSLPAITTAVAGVIVWASVQWFAGGFWTPLVQPLMAIGLAFVGQLAWQYFVEGREKRQVKTAVLALRAEGRLRTADGRPGPRGAGRPASHNDRAVLGCARFHRDVGEGDARRSRRASSTSTSRAWCGSCSSTAGRSISSWATW